VAQGVASSVFEHLAMFGTLFGRRVAAGIIVLLPYTSNGLKNATRSSH
jgi:hypothetical protein